MLNLVSLSTCVLNLHQGISPPTIGHIHLRCHHPVVDLNSFGSNQAKHAHFVPPFASFHWLPVAALPPVKPIDAGVKGGHWICIHTHCIIPGVLCPAMVC